MPDKHGQTSSLSGRKENMHGEESSILRYEALVLEDKGVPAAGSGEVSPECIAIMKNLNETAMRLEREANEGVISSVVNFIVQASGGAAPAAALSQDEGSTQNPGAVYSGIPSCLLLAGVNLQDHESTFAHIAETLPRRTPCHVAVLTPTECSSLSLCLDSLFNQFALPPSRPKSSSSLAMLRSWHAAKTQAALGVDGSAGSSEKRGGRPPKGARTGQKKAHADACGANKDAPLVVLIRDVESFDAVVLQDLVGLCHQERRSSPGDSRGALPFVFILAVSTTRHALHSLLPHSTATKLQIEHRFSLPPAKALLSGLLEDFLLNGQYTFTLGEKPLSFLLNRFFSDSCTLKSFTQSFQYAVLTHFEENPLAPLSAALPPAQILSLLSSKGILEHIKGLRSVSAALSGSSRITQKDVCMWLLDMSSLRARLKCAHQVISAAFLAAGPPAAAAARQRKPPSLHDVLLDALGGWRVREDGRAREGLGIQEGEATSLDSACAVLRFSKPQDLSDALLEMASSLRKLQASLAALEGSFFQDGGLGKAAGIPKAGSTVLSAVRDRAKKMAEQAESYARAAEEEVDRAPLYAPTDRGASVLAIQRAGKLRKGPNVAEASRSWLEEPNSRRLRSDVINLFKDAVMLCPSPATLPMHEAMCLTRASQLSRALDACPRKAVHDALRRPTDYLTPVADANGDAAAMPSSSRDAPQSSSTKNEGEMPVHLMPDACILYKLSLEEGRVVNIPEWLRAFRSVCHRDKGKVAKGGDAMVQARFMSALTQLQIVGYFKKNKGNSDMAERIVFPPPPPPEQLGEHGGELGEKMRGLPPAARKRKEDAERVSQAAGGGASRGPGRPSKRLSVM